MSTSGSSDSWRSATEGLASETDQPAGPSVLPPFSGNLIVDEKLNLSNANFKQTIDNFFKDQNLSPLSQLTPTPLFPTPHVLAQFASKAYTDYNTEETDAQYERRLDLPDGWKLLTTASNSSKANDYFGAAYWHPEHQQVVIAHRGTKLTSLGALWTDLVGVLFKHHVPQMGSASTFANKVVEVLGEVKQEKGVSFQLFFTGHSLGGWLAQITNFTIKYLKTEGNTFLKSNNEQNCYHPHTVVFDSPGCQDMLSQMRDTFDVRLDGRSIALEHLDITSYLSAPNRINSCNKHLGTVYRIFPDFSDMGWWKKHTALYNLETHSMDKIVEAFDRATGQLHKNEQRQLKVRVVVDWPISAGLKRGKEYKNFFEWSKHLNDYHPDITNENFLYSHYSQIRYQTKRYDERVNSFTIFSQEEQEFLQSYLWLRQWPELFKLKEMFSPLDNNQAQEEAVIMLQSFEIENNKIRCTDAIALQALIPYVKRLLQLFPEIKENTKNALSSDEVRNRVYQFETRRYVKRILQSPLEFNPDAASLREFLEGGKKKVLHLQVVKGEEWTGLIQVHQVLQKNGCLSEGQYTVLKLKRLLKVNQLMDFSKLMQSKVTPHLLLMVCKDNQQMDEESKDVIRSLFDTIKQKQNIKIIYITRSEGSIVDFLHHMGRRISGKGFVRVVQQLTWSDLTASSQKKLLEKSIQFQGAKFSLNEIMAAESPVATFLPLCDLLEENEFNIADPLPIHNAYNPSCYIERAFRRQMAINLDIHTDRCEQKFRDLLAGSEQGFKQLCQLYPENNVHWLVTEKSGKLVWQQSQGSLETLRRYIDTESSQTYTTDDLDKLLEQAEHQRLMLISGTAGMGKSTLLTHLSKQIKQKFPAKWVVRINLNDHTNALKELEKQQTAKLTAIEFVSEKLLKLHCGLEMELFKQCCKEKRKLRIVIMFDGFDEISPFYKQTVMELLQALSQTAVEQLWVTTRPHLREELEDKLQQLSYTLEPFTEKDQVELLTKFWSLNDWFIELEEKEEDVTKKKLEIYAEHLIKRLAQSIRDKDKQFTGIPLQTRMLAEAFVEEAKTFCRSVESTPELPLELDLLGLYERFIERKYDIYQEEKFRLPADNVVAKEQRERDLKSMREDHQLLALKVLFTEEQVALLQNNRESSFSAEQLTRIGIVQLSHDGKPQFIHRIFAEYYVADYLMNHLSKWNNSSQQVLDFILKDILQESECRVIRAFINAFLSRSQPSDEVVKHYGKRIHALGMDKERKLLNVAVEGDANIIEFLLQCLLDAGDRITFTKISNFVCTYPCAGYSPDGKTLYGKYLNLRRRYKCEPTARYNRSECYTFKFNYRQKVWKRKICCDPRKLTEIWEWAEENLTREEIKNELLLATDNEEETVWYVAAEFGNLYVLQKIFEWAERNLTREEINNKLLLATDNIGRTAWHVVAARGKLDALQKIWELAKETLTREEINNKLLLATDDMGRTAWHIAAETSELDIFNVAAGDGNLYVLIKIWEWAKGNLTREEISNKLFLATDNMGRTAWHMVAAGGKLDLLQKIWELAEENLTREEINNKLLLATDNMSWTAWHMAAEGGKLDVLQKIWELAKDNLTREEINNKLLLATDNTSWTAWHMAAERGKLDVFQKIWEFAKENLTREEINNKLLLATDSMSWTAWHVAAEGGKLDVLQKIWEWAKENLTREEIKNKLLLATDDLGRTVWYKAAECDNVQVLQKIWEFAKENLTIEEINNKLLLATDNTSWTAWHVAAERGKLDVLQKIWEWAKENLTREEINNKLLLATDDLGRTVWYKAAERDNVEALQKIWELAKENLTREEIRNKLLLAPDHKGKTVWHVAASVGKEYLLLTVWKLSEEFLTTDEFKSKLLLATDSDGNTAWHSAVKRGVPFALTLRMILAKSILTTEEINNKLLFATDIKGRTAWHVAAERERLDLLQEIWEWAKKNLTREEINILLATENMGKTAWHVAVEAGDIDILQEIWEWAKENLTKEEINLKLLLVADKKGRTAWHVATERGKLDLLQNIWEWAKKNQTGKERSNILLATENIGRTAWHVAAEMGELYILQKIWEWAKENLTKEQINLKLLLATDKRGRTAWHVATETGKLDLLQEIWEWTKKNLTREEINNMLLATDNKGRTAWHVAAEGGKLCLLQKIWELAIENLTREEVNNKLLLATDNMCRTVWHVAAEGGKLDILQNTWEWAKDNLTREEIRNKLLLATDHMGRTTWQVATAGGYLNVSQKIWELAKENLTREEISNKLLLATDNMCRTAWHMAVNGGEYVLCEIWEWVEENHTREEMNNILLLPTNNCGFHVTGEGGENFVLQKILSWAKENLTREEVNNKLFLATDSMGRTAWHLAAEEGKFLLLQKIWEWAKESLPKEDINSKFLLATDKRGKNIFHIVTEKGRLNVILKVWEWAKENLTTDEIINKFLSATHNTGRTAWHIAAEASELDLLQKIWEWAKTNLTKEEINNKLLLATDKRGRPSCTL